MSKEIYDEAQKALEAICQELNELKERVSELESQNSALKEQVQAQKAYLAWCKDTKSVPMEDYPFEQGILNGGGSGYNAER